MCCLTNLHLSLLQASRSHHLVHLVLSLLLAILDVQLSLSHDLLEHDESLLKREYLLAERLHDMNDFLAELGHEGEIFSLRTYRLDKWVELTLRWSLLRWHGACRRCAKRSCLAIVYLVLDMLRCLGYSIPLI